MTISININGMTLKNFSHGLETHIARYDRESAINIMDYTHSFIDPNESRYNMELFRNPELNGTTCVKYVREKFKKLNENRKADNLRAKRNNANVCGRGTLQISLDSLEKMGYVLDEKWSNQTDEAKELVTNAYKSMLRVFDNRENAGELLLASLHVDESTPHVDFIVNGIDENDYNFDMRGVLNGFHGEKKGEKLSNLQDKLEESIMLTYETEDIVKYDLFRGIPKTGRKKKEKTLKRREKDVNEREKILTKTFINRANKQQTRERNISHFERVLDEREQKVSEQEKEVQRRSEKLSEREKKVNEREANLEKKERELDSRATNLDLLERNISHSERVLANKEEKVKEIETHAKNCLKSLLSQNEKVEQQANERIRQFNAVKKQYELLESKSYAISYVLQMQYPDIYKQVKEKTVTLFENEKNEANKQQISDSDLINQSKSFHTNYSNTSNFDFER